MALDSGSDSVQINGLNEGNFDDVFCDNIEVSSNATILGNLIVGGSQIYTGTATFANAVQLNGPLFGLTGGVGINYDPLTKTITNTLGNFWSLTGSDIVNQVGTVVNLTREGGSSKLVLNYGATGASRVGIFYNDNGSTSIDYPLITTSTGTGGGPTGVPDEVLISTPNNQTFGGYISLYPAQLSGPTADRNYVILQKSALATQDIDSNLNVNGSLSINTFDYRSYFSATGFSGLTYNGTGAYDLDISSIDQSKWDIASTTIYPKTASQILIGTTGSADPFSAIHIKSDIRPRLLIESTTASFTPGLGFKNQSALFGAISQDATQDRIDVSLNSVNNVASFLPNKVGVNNINPTHQLEVQNEAGSSATVISSYNDNANGFAGSFLRNNVGNPLVLFGNGSTRSADGGPNVANIRNDTGEKIRLQNNYEFALGSPENITGDPTHAPLLQGSSLNDQFTFTSTVFVTPHIYVAGWYFSTSNITAKNFDNTNSSFTLPNTVSTRRAFIIQYTTAGLVNNVWSLPTSLNSETKNLYVGANNIYLCGKYSSTTSITISNLDGTTSFLTLPSTTATPGLYAGFLIAFNLTTGVANRLNTIFGNNNSANDNFIGGVVEDSSGNVYACGTVFCDTTASINNFINTPTGLTLAATLRQNGFIIRWDISANYSAHWAWDLSSFPCYANDITIAENNTLYVAMSIFNFGSAVTLPNWVGAGSSSFQILAAGIYSNAIWSSSLLRFTNITSASPICNGRQAFGNNSNVGYSPIALSTVYYSPINNVVYWGTPATNIQQIAFFSNLTDAAFGLTISPPQGDQNTGILLFTISHSSGSNTAFPSQIWSNSSVYSGADFIYRIRENPANGEIYIQGGVFSDNTPVYLGPVEAQSRLTFPFNTTPGIFYYHAFSIKMNSSNVPLGMSLIPFSRNQSYSSDICFPSPTTPLVINTISNHSSQFIRNYDQYPSAFSLPVTTAFNLGVLVRYTTSKVVSTFTSSSGVGFGRLNSGIAELEVEKGIYTPHFVQCREIRVNDAQLHPFKFVDSSGREMGSLCRAWISIDGTRAFQPIIRASMNVRFVDKLSNGKYRIFFSQLAPHDRFATFVSSCGFLGNNYTIAPFIVTSNTVQGSPNFKTISGIEVGIVQTGGGGFDVAECNVSCFW